jgi:hypothetical protein
MCKVSDINRTRVGTDPNTRRESTDYETSGISRINTQGGWGGWGSNPGPTDYEKLKGPIT